MDTGTNAAFVVGMGLLLGVLTLRAGYVGTPTDLSSRVVPVDFLCLGFLAVLFVRHAMEKPPVPCLLYVLAVVLALVPGLLISPGPEREAWVQFAGLLMALAFYVVGLNIGASKRLLTAFLAALAIAVFAQAVVVFHDALSPHQWFPDPMEGRVRGTFRANGQLGAYAFCAGGLLVTVGTTLGSARLKWLSALAALLCASFVFLASRRTGMVCVFLWGAIILVAGWRYVPRRVYAFFATGFLAVLVLLAVFWPHVESSFAGRRFTEAVSSVRSRDGFIAEQLRNCAATAEHWFPLGFGPGRGYLIDRRDGHEVHNGLLAVTVELGVLGLAGYLGMVLYPLVRRSRSRGSGQVLQGFLMTVFLLVSLVFMIHNTLYRDRTFLLGIGIATSLARRGSRPGEQEELLERTGGA